MKKAGKKQKQEETLRIDEFIAELSLGLSWIIGIFDVQFKELRVYRPYLFFKTRHVSEKYNAASLGKIDYIYLFVKGLSKRASKALKMFLFLLVSCRLLSRYDPEKDSPAHFVSYGLGFYIDWQRRWNENRAILMVEAKGCNEQRTTEKL